MALMDISIKDDWRPLQSEFKGKAKNLVTVVEEDGGNITNDVIIEKLETAQKGNNVFLVNEQYPRTPSGHFPPVFLLLPNIEKR